MLTRYLRSTVLRVLAFEIRSRTVDVDSQLLLLLLCHQCQLESLPRQIVSYLLDLPEKDEEEVERAQINSFDTLWGETGGGSRVAPTRS